MEEHRFSLKPNDIIVGCAVLWVVIATLWLGIPQANRLQAKQTTLRQMEGELTDLRQQYESLVLLGEKLTEYTNELSRLAVALPSTEQAPEALIQLQTIADRSGVIVNELQPSKARDGELPVQVTIRGSYEAINSFLKELEANIRPIIVKRFHLATSGESTAPLIATMSLHLAFQKNAASTATPAAGGDR